ncbi:MAG: SLC13/DASS family transporter [Candidatus Schekmanbacteria bacterium]|nr:MAG: SLC13/DASS family transporter [Candidatus Schekmanbacteria bacterium]
MIDEKISPEEEKFEKIRSVIGFIVGPILFSIIILFNYFQGNSIQGRLAAVVILVIIFWITEAIPIPVAALLGPSLCVILGVDTMKEVFAPFSHPIIFLMMGTFIIAKAMSSNGVDKVIASVVIRNRLMSKSKIRLLLAFGLVVWFLSMWLSNTATTAMMVPIAISIVSSMEEDEKGKKRFSTSLMLMIAFSASIGGISTPIGTPPNLIALGMIEKYLNIRIYFFQWMFFALPLSTLIFISLFFVMKRGISSKEMELNNVKKIIGEDLDKKKITLSKAQKNVLISFLLTVFLWICPGIMIMALGKNHPFAQFLVSVMPEAVAALIGTALLFFLPVNWKERKFTLDWKEAAKIDWGTILLFGGGLSLGSMMFKTGLAASFGNYLIEATNVKTLFGVTILFCIVAVMLTETTSNTASANMIIPIAIAVSQNLSINPVIPALASCFATSLAFMLPVSTPPNAIVYGTGYVPIRKMIVRGIIVDIIGIAIICTMALSFFQRVL